MAAFILATSAFAQKKPGQVYSDPGSEIGIDDLNAEQIIDLFKPALISIWLNEKDFYSYATNSYIDTTLLNGSGFIFRENGLPARDSIFIRIWMPKPEPHS